jgi:hypothetical protein
MFLENFTKNWKCAAAASIFVAANLKITRDRRRLCQLMPGLARRRLRRFARRDLDTHKSARARQVLTGAGRSATARYCLAHALTLPRLLVLN